MFCCILFVPLSLNTYQNPYTYLRFLRECLISVCYLCSVALFNLKDYQSALDTFKEGQKLDGKNFRMFPANSMLEIISLLPNSFDYLLFFFCL